MAQAVLSDVAVRLGRQPLPEEAALLEARLDDAEAAIMRRIPGLVAQVGTDERFRLNLVAVECDVALRASGIPGRQGNLVPSPGEVQAIPDAPGSVTIRAEEWRKLGIHMMDVWNPYPNPYEELSPYFPSPYDVGWRSWNQWDLGDPYY